MKKIAAALFCLLVGSTSLAYGDAIISADVTNRDLNGVLCSASGLGSSVSVSCGDQSANDGYASVVGNVGPTSGQVHLQLDSNETHTSVTYATGGFGVSVTGTYVLTGNGGYGFAEWTMSSFTSTLGEGHYGPCTISFDGVTQNCDLNFISGVSGAFYVPENVPLPFSLSTSFNADASFEDGVTAIMSYDLVNLQPVPEPASLTLLGLGLLTLPAAMMFRNRRTA